MTGNGDSPFKPGVRVAIRNQYGDGFIPSVVDKVHKSGNFTLEGSRQQWRPCSPGTLGAWTARATGDRSWNTKMLFHWNETTNAMITKAIDDKKRWNRWTKLHGQITRIQPNDLTDAMLDQIETALPKKDGGTNAR